MYRKALVTQLRTMETVDQDVGEPLLLSPQLPYPVRVLLLKHLDIFALKTLRLVCKTTKSWVETPELLRHFYVRITDKVWLNEVLRAPDPVPWNSFVFSDECKCLSRADIQRFLAAYADTVRHLELDLKLGRGSYTQEREFTQSLLCGCPHLESLNSEVFMFCGAELLDNWKNLRYFHVQRIVGDFGRLPTEMAFFSHMLSTCAKLETLTIPHFSSRYRDRKEFDYDHHFQRLVLTPLLDTIARGGVRGVAAPEEGLDDQFLLPLAIACRENETTLLNVRRTFLKNLPPEHLSVLDIIGNLDGITDKIIRQPLTKVLSISFTRPSFQVRDNVYDMPPFPNLKHVHIDSRVSEKVDPTNLELFANRLAKVKRPTVQRFSIRFPRHISPVELCASFVNLRVLELEDWRGDDAEWLKLWPLVGHSLVWLAVSNCPNLTDMGILENDLCQPAFLQLKHLRHLSLDNWSVNLRKTKQNISELSFMHAFCHLRLRSFVFREGGWICQGSLSAEALEAMWYGPFGETIEYFFVQSKDQMESRPRRKLMPLLGGQCDDYPNFWNVCCSIL